MSRIFLLVPVMFLIMLLPAALAAEEDQPVARCRRVEFRTFLPGTFGGDKESRSGSVVVERQAGERKQKSALIQKTADFNGDGCAELVIGAPRTTVDGIANRGMVRIYYSAVNGLPNGSRQNLLLRDDLGRGFGEVVSTGDYNGDGYDDLVVSEPQRTVSGVSNAGAVHVFYGSENGLVPDGGVIWHQNSAGVPGGAEKDDLFGYSLASGKFNGDGYTDLAVGIPFEAIGDVEDAGYVIILYGGANGLSGASARGWHQDTDGIEGKPEVGVQFGRALAAGNFGMSGLEDLAIGAPYEDAAVLGDTHGAVHMLYGSGSGLLATDSHRLTQASYGVGGSPETGDTFGYALAAADFDGNGWQDLAVGSPGEDVLGYDNAGRVDVFYGRSGKTLTGAGSDDWYQGLGGVGREPGKGNNFGRALVGADFNGDNYADLAIGSPFEDLGYYGNAGLVTVLFGGPEQGIDSDGVRYFDYINDPNRKRQGEEGDFNGWALTAGDYDHDGYWDLVAGVPGAEESGAVGVARGWSGGITWYKFRFLTPPDDIAGVEVSGFGRSLR